MPTKVSFGISTSMWDEKGIDGQFLLVPYQMTYEYVRLKLSAVSLSLLLSLALAQAVPFAPIHPLALAHMAA